jgi:hypothetical protein
MFEEELADVLGRWRYARVGKASPWAATGEAANPSRFPSLINKLRVPSNPML